MKPENQNPVGRTPARAKPEITAPFRRRYRRSASCSGPTEAAVLGLAAAWCRNVVKITVLNQARFAAIAARLADGYAPADCRAAIIEYGRDDWHRKTGNWLDLADFFKPQKLDLWLRKAERRSERRPASPAARRLAAGIGRTAAGDDMAAFGRLPTDTRNRIWRQADEELRSLGCKVCRHSLHRQSVVIMRREGLAPARAKPETRNPK